MMKRRHGFSYVGACQWPPGFFLPAGPFASFHMTATPRAESTRLNKAVSDTVASKGSRRTQSAIRALSPSRRTAHEIKYEPTDAHSLLRAQTPVEGSAHKTSRAAGRNISLRGYDPVSSPSRQAEEAYEAGIWGQSPQGVERPPIWGLVHAQDHSGHLLPLERLICPDHHPHPNQHVPRDGDGGGLVAGALGDALPELANGGIFSDCSPRCLLQHPSHVEGASLAQAASTLYVGGLKDLGVESRVANDRL